MAVKVDGRGGHNPACGGANKIVNEVTENRKIHSEVSRLLAADPFFDYQDTTPGSIQGSSNDMYHGVSRANARGVNLFFSTHLNDTAAARVESAIGTEVLIYSKSRADISGLCGYAICEEMAKLGFINRGIKTSPQIDGLYEIRNTAMAAMIIECFFTNSAKDVELYRSLGPEKVAYAIYMGIRRGYKATSQPAGQNPNVIERTCANCKNFSPIS
ncbi:N-acetylmuramoyl-L-alanine amidase [Clostridium sp.]|uniref:N-acetylmuramoyl-L-alanine amidase n=1 Tax=Clostridium sp. TaxID=1506 RepID=UPI002FC96664